MFFEKSIWLLCLIPAASLLAALAARGGRTRAYLALAAAAAALLAAGAASPRVLPAGRGRIAVVVVDRSSSVTLSLDDEILSALLGSIADRFEPSDRVGLVLFGGEAIVALEPGPPSRLKSKVAGGVPDRDRTDISAALDTAASMLPVTGGEILLISDGRDNASSGRTAAAFASRGARVHAAPAGESPPGDFGIESLEGPTRASPGSVIMLSARAFSRSGGDATVTIEDETGRCLHCARARFAPGSSLVFRTQVAVSAGDRFFTARISTAAPPDPWPSNDSAGFALRAGDSVRILYLSDDPAGRILNRVLRSDPGVEVRESKPFRLGDRPGFADTDVVVVDGADAESLGASRMAAIEAFVRDGGGGLILAGGSGGFGPGGFFGTPVESVSPVRCDPDEKSPLALALVLDASGSMQEMAAQDVRKFDFARAAAGMVIDRMREGDWIAVIPFSERPLLDPSLRAEIRSGPARGISAALGMLVPRGSTSILRALEAGVEAVSARTEARRHVLLLSDGLENVAADGGSYAALRQRVEAAGISVSAAVAQSGSAPPDIAFFERNVVFRGRIYLVGEFSELPRDFIEDVTRARGELVRSGRFVPVPGLAPPGMESPAEPPAVGSYVRTSLKEDGTSALSVGPDKDPLVAWKRSGLGRVVAFTSSLDEGYAPDWNKWQGDGGGLGGLRGFFAGWTRWAAGEGRRLAVEASCAGGRATIRASVKGGPPLPDGLNLSARVVAQGRPVSELAMTQDAPNSYSCVLDAPGPGLYRALVLMEPGRRIVGEGGFYSGDNAETRLLGPDREALRSLVRGGGRYWTDPRDFAPGPVSPGIMDITAAGWPLLAASAVFLALSAFARGRGRRERSRT